VGTYRYAFNIYKPNVLYKMNAYNLFMIEFLILLSFGILVIIVIAFILLGRSNAKKNYTNMVCPVCGHQEVVIYMSIMGLLTPMYTFTCENCSWTSYSSTFPSMVTIE
jgi:hypothetical protein